MKGMSLVEVVVTITILSFISIFTFTTTQTGFNVRNKSVAENDFYHSVRTTIRHIERDIMQAFHNYQDTSMGQLYYMQKTSFKAYESKSIFIGTKDKLTFTSNSHRRMYRDTKETTTCEISYFLESNKDNPSVNDLLKRESTFIDDKLEEGGDIFTIGSDIESINFRYLGEIPDVWLDSWDSLQRDTRYKFPVAVEVNIAFKDREKTFLITQIVKLLNPNNIARTNIQSGENSETE
jgi:general secretion pathway protein J